MTVRKFITLAEMRAARHGWHIQNAKVALVPTMGALHKGHLSLVEQAKELADVVLATIFVNPKQFAPGEDFAKYPRTLAEDIEKLASVKADGVFLPTAADMYPDQFQTHVSNSTMSQILCGASRPHFFGGVLTVVMKLFNITQPHLAVFGKKDYQQFRIIERMVRDLAMPVDVVGGETVREADGLAMSSRNAYLSPDERKQAVGLSKALFSVRDQFAAGVKSTTELVQIFKNALTDFPALELEYFEIKDQASLSSCNEPIDQSAVALTAAKLGETRLIDNVELNHE